MLAERKDVSFKAIDGIVLRGWWFSAGTEKGPWVILTCGLTALKEHFVDDFAKEFQKAGSHALLYDNRCFGTSDGLPRFDGDPVKAQDDYLDAFDYVASLPEVDSDRIAYWGSSYAAGVAVCAAAVDRRVKAVVTQAPFVSGELQLETHMAFLPSVYKDRARIRVGEAHPLTGIVASLKEAEQGNARVILPDTIAYQYFEDSSAQGGKWENKMTTMTLFRMLRFKPIGFIHRIAPTPFLMVIGGNDVSVLTSHQLQAFELAREPKQLHILKGCGHFGPYRGKYFEENIAVQIKYLKQHL